MATKAIKSGRVLVASTNTSSLPAMLQLSNVSQRQTTRILAGQLGARPVFSTWNLTHGLSIHTIGANRRIPAAAAVDPVTEDKIADLEELVLKATTADVDNSGYHSDHDEVEHVEEEDWEDGPVSFSSLYSVDDESEDEKEIDPTLLLANCGLSDITVNALEKRGIRSLFAIQKMVFEPAMAGTDLIARAKTGSGKTLAFALPVVEKIMQGMEGQRPAKGRPPQCIVLAPTRELAKQVEREFASVAPSLFVSCFYGGAPIGPQIKTLQRGVDVVVGTPGRVIDLIDQNALDLGSVRFVILDEADTMLNVGFEKDVETILENVPTERQTMLFSATVPKWVKKLVKSYLNEPVNIDLIGEDSSGKMSETITALGVQVSDACRRSVLVDLLTVYAESQKAIVFVQTKRDADEVAAAVALHIPCEPLHGDMAQGERERVMNGFRAGRINVLVATDVAARGLDIPDVDLVVHYELPKDPEGFLHRSGRTGRAGRNGTAIAMYTMREIGYFKRILRETDTTGVEVIGPPTPAQVMEAAAKQVMYRLDGVDDEVKKVFMPVAKLVLSSKSPEEALVAALAALSGIKEVPKPRSLLSLVDTHATLKIMSAPGRINKPSAVMAIVARLLDDNNHAARIGRIRLLQEPGLEGAAFDVPHDMVELVMAQKEELEKRGVSLSMPESLPAEEGLYDPPGSRRGRRGDDDDFFERRRLGERGGFRGGRGGGRGGYGGDRGGRSFGGGGGGRRDFGGDRRGGSDRFENRGGRSFGDDRRGGGRGGGGGGSWDRSDRGERRFDRSDRPDRGGGRKNVDGFRGWGFNDGAE